MFVAGIFLSLIGLFPSSTKPHDFISLWFFIQIRLSLLPATLGMVKDRRIIHSLVLWVLIFVGPLGAIFIDWPSVALLEIFGVILGVILIDIYVIILTISF